MIAEQWLGEDNKLGLSIFNGKYRYNNESFEEWLDRVSAGNQDLKKLILEKKFLFGGRILANRGLPERGVKCCYANCFVDELDDSIEEIFDCAKRMARTYAAGGGVGINIGKLAPRGSRVRNSAKVTSGAVSFMDLYSMVTGIIGQSGRRGALMISMPVSHPDIEEFVDVKNDLNKVTKANISVMIDDNFMEAVKNHKKYTCYFKREATGEEITKEIDAYKLFYHIAENVWRNGEPGILMWGNIERYNLRSDIPEFQFAGTNPCRTKKVSVQGLVETL